MRGVVGGGKSYLGRRRIDPLFLIKMKVLRRFFEIRLGDEYCLQLMKQSII